MTVKSFNLLLSNIHYIIIIKLNNTNNKPVQSNYIGNQTVIFVLFPSSLDWKKSSLCIYYT